MKIRTGFVSNSFRSSFVVAFPRDPKSSEEVRDMMFGDTSISKSSYKADSYETSVIAAMVFNAIKMQKPNNRKNILEAIVGGWFDGVIQADEFMSSTGEVDWGAWGRANKRAAKEIVDKKMIEWGNSKVYVFDYGDNDGDFGSMMAHGGIFDKLPNIVTSYH